MAIDRITWVIVWGVRHVRLQASRRVGISMGNMSIDQDMGLLQHVFIMCFACADSCEQAQQTLCMQAPLVALGSFSLLFGL